MTSDLSKEDIVITGIIVAVSLMESLEKNKEYGVKNGWVKEKSTNSLSFGYRSLQNSNKKRSNSSGSKIKSLLEKTFWQKVSLKFGNIQWIWWLCCGQTEWQAAGTAQKQMAGPIKFDKHCVSKRHTQRMLLALFWLLNSLESIMLYCGLRLLQPPKQYSGQAYWILHISQVPSLYNTNQIFFQSVWW